MKRIILSIVLLITVVTMNAQVCNLIPQATYHAYLPVNDINTFNNTKKETLYVHNSGYFDMNFNQVKNVVFFNTQSIATTINLQGEFKKVFIDKDAFTSIKQITLDGGHSVNVSGTVYITDISINNSNPSNPAAIYVNTGGKLYIKNVAYVAGQVYNNQNGNQSNNLYILQGCQLTLPVKWLNYTTSLSH